MKYKIYNQLYEIYYMYNQLYEIYKMYDLYEIY